MAQRITETLAKSAATPLAGSRTRIIYDADLKGFGLRITAAGARAFILNYRIFGRERRLTIGSYPEWSATAARRHAETLKREIDIGNDPMATRDNTRASPSITELCDLYELRHLPKKRPSSQRNDVAVIAQIVKPRLGTMKVVHLAHSDVDALHREISKRAPFRANRVIALLSKMMSLAIRWGYRADNPVTGIERNPEAHRSRYLNRDELARLAGALNGYANKNVASAVRLLLFTGARRGEVLAAMWEHFDLERGTWTKPRSNTKQKREHRVPLSSTALRLLVEMRATASGPYVFPAKGGATHLTDIKKAWATLCKTADIADCRLHDLRHTYASYLASAGYSLPVVGALLGHTQAQTTQRYAHLLDDPLREATEKFGVLVDLGPRK
ncbi:tyrosine-type recombinase/integrase [Methylobacterium sp. WL64]|uniref:tyrosine-type recombinase/integrase n=1 Tax=Methylobacterium sp. WL64 TaxID=2603894 RepID=UPI0011CC9D63|nr:site-specific integrase [Methylobacterium sp. WL64]TXN05916.1 tyrosine-type recombinase/integrase [Methylobacterium sp. WL64]